MSSHINESVMKKFLYGMQVKGAQVCDGIEVSAEGDIFTSDGTAFTSFVKDAEMVFGELDGSTFTPCADVANPGANDKHYMKLTRGRGDVQYKLVRGLNDLIGKDNDAADVIDQLSDLSAEIALVRSEVESAIAANEIITNNDVDRLELAFDNYITQLDSDLDYAIAEFLRMANLRDARILADFKADIEDRRELAQSIFDRDVGHAVFLYSDLVSNQHVEFLRPIDSTDVGRSVLSNWAVQVRLKDENGKVQGDSIMYSAIITNAFWQDEPKTSLGTDDQGFGQTDALKVTVSADACGAMHASTRLVINCIYGGDMTNKDQPVSYTYDSLTDDLELYNASGGHEAVGEIGTAEQPLADSDSATQASGGVQKVQPMTRNN